VWPPVTQPPDDDRPRHRRFRPNGVSVTTRLAAAVLLVSLVSLVVATIVGVTSGSDLGRDIYETRLASLSTASASDVAGELVSTRSGTEALALSPATAVAIDAFDQAFTALSDETEIDAAAASIELTTAYDDTYLSVPGPSGAPPSIGEVVAADPRALYLQTVYSIETVDVETGEIVSGDPSDGQNVEVRVVADPGRLDDAGDASGWTQVHREYHPAYRRIRGNLRLLDLYFIEPNDSRIVYSVGKGPDLGTSLVTGPFGGSVLANTVDRVIDDPDAGTAVSDLSLYNGAPGNVVGVMASPVMDGGVLAGVVAAMYDGADFTEILNTAAVADVVEDDGDAADDGNSAVADVYLIGSDGTLRSDPLAYVEDPVAFLDLSEASGLLTAPERAEIEVNGTTVLVQPAVGATFSAAEAGDDDVTERPSTTGGTVYGTVDPVPFDGVQWYVASEADVVVAETTLDDFRNILIVGASLFVIVTAFVGVWWASRLLAPVRTISERLGTMGVDHEPLTIPEQSPVEMHHLVSSFDSMAATLDHQQVALAVAREERLGLLRQLLPTAVANRLANGDVDSLERVPQASAVVLVVRGLGQLVRSSNSSSNRDLVDRLHSELDGLAEQHGLDRIKVVGDAYFAACGHDRPFIDHAPRVVTFATDARDAVRAVGTAAGVDLDVAVGVDTGPVSVGMTGGSRLVYDVWGGPVSTAHLLARSAGAGTILVSDITRSMLPDEIPVDAADVDGFSAWAVADTAMGSIGGGAPGALT
jgi:class 3 adenylate cyclase